MATKKTIAKAPKKTTTKITIDYKVVGRNVITVIEGIKRTKVYVDKAKKQEFMKLLDSFNKRNSKAKLSKIISILTDEKATPTQRVQKAKKTVKKAEVVKKPKVSAKKEVAKVDTVAEAKHLLEKEGYVVSKKAPAQKRRRGEY